MARIPFAERPSSLKVLGSLFVALMIVFVWLTFAVFNKSFVNFDKVTLTGAKAGLSLPENADIKLRGMIVGEVRGIESTDGVLKITLGMDPDFIDEVPADVTAEIIPKTLFGEKYISLLPPANSNGQKLKAGDTIKGAEVPIEVEKLLNDIYPLLNAVDPVNLSYTLSAVADALDGRGEDLGTTLVTLNSYLKKLNPETPQLVNDLVKLGSVSDVYAAQMPTIGRLLKNTVITGNTVVAKRTQLAAFFDEGTRLANTLTKFTKDNGDNLEALAAQSVAPLDVAARYSSTFPCFLRGLDKTVFLADSVLRNRTVHIELETLAEQPTAYNDPSAPGNPPPENAVFPKQSVINNTPAADVDNHGRTDAGGPAGLGAVCDDLKKYGQGSGPYGDDPPFTQANPIPTFPSSVYKLIGIKNSHNGKFGPESDYNRAPAASLDAVDSSTEQLGLRRIAAAMSGVPTADVPDVASLLLGPVVRGSEVSMR